MKEITIMMSCEAYIRLEESRSMIGVRDDKVMVESVGCRLCWGQRTVEVSIL